MGVRARIPRWAWGLPALPVALTALWTASVLTTASASETGQSMRSSSGLRAASLPDLAPSPIAVRRTLPRAAPLPPAVPPAPPVPPVPSDPCDAKTLPEGPDADEHFYVSGDRKVVSLTFDDGPSHIYTPRILDVLAKHEVKATFFVLGRRVEKHPDVVAQVAEAGHDIGNHSYSHPSFRSLWPIQIKDEVCRTNAAVKSAAGVRPTLFRPPFGRYADSAVPLLGKLGMNFVLWSIDGEDWESDDPKLVADKIVGKAKPGSIILLHDRESITVQALPAIIRGLRAKGFSIEPVSTALLDRESSL